MIATNNSITVQGSLSQVAKSGSASESETFDKYRITAVDFDVSFASRTTDIDQDAIVNISLVPGTAYEVTVQSIKDEECINGDPNGVEGEEATFTVCSSKFAKDKYRRKRKIKIFSCSKSFFNQTEIGKTVTEI